MFWKRKQEPSQRIVRSRGDPELDGLREELARRQERVAALELELFDTRADLASFEQQLESRIAPLQRRLDEVQAQLAEARRRAARRGQWGDRADSGGVPVDVVDQFAKAWARTEPEPGPPPASPLPDQASEMEIKTLYRALAKRFHPDLSSDPEEKQWRQQMMADVNAAYSARNRHALEALAAQPDRPPAVMPKTRSDILIDLKTEIHRLGGVIADLERTLDELASSPTVQLKLDVSLAQRAGRDLLREMASDLEAEIARCGAELAALK